MVRKMRNFRDYLPILLANRISPLAMEVLNMHATD